MIREMRRIDLSQVMAIEDASFKDGHYSKEQMLYELNENPFSTILVMIDDAEEIVGFLIYMVTFNSATIVQIATRPFNRKKGVATKLINEMVKRLTKKYGEIENVTLEVRKPNKIAHKFYLKNKFKDVTIKKKYYDNGDDAIYMMRVLL